MIKINPRFKDECIQIFGEADGVKVYNFYKKYLNTRQSSKQDKFMSLTERRLKSINYLVKNYGKEAVLSGIDYYIDKVQKGDIIITTIPYFNKVVENNVKKFNEPKQTFQKTIISKPKIQTVIPIISKKVSNDYDDSFYNHLYKCTNCGEEIDPWQLNCPTCQCAFEWEKVII